MINCDRECHANSWKPFTFAKFRNGLAGDELLGKFTFREMSCMTTIIVLIFCLQQFFKKFKSWYGVQNTRCSEPFGCAEAVQRDNTNGECVLLVK